MQKKINTQEDIRQLIMDIEKKWPVDKWVISDIHVWPYIRIKIYIYLLSKIFSNPPKTGSVDNVIIKKHVIFIYYKKIRQLISAFFNLIFLFFKLKNKKAIFFGAHYHRIIHKGEYFNRFYDSMIDYHDLKNDVYMIEYGKIYESYYNNEAIINLGKYLNDYKLVIKLFKKFSSKKINLKLEGFDEFCKEINIIIPSLNKESLLSWSQKINSLKGFYQFIYKKVKPQKIVFLRYYGVDDLTAAILVANKLKIETVDLQHGTQINNMAFSDWTKVPAEGFNTVAKVFWTWDQESKENIDLWANKIETVSAKVIGQPYMSYWLNRQSKINNSEKQILYTLHLSKIDEMISKDMISLIKKLDYNWVLRLHPRNSLNIDEITEFIFENEINEKVILQSSIEMPLPEILSKSILHITNYSGSVIEARMMNIPTLIINKLGLEIYKQYIDNKLVFFIDYEENNFTGKFEDLIKNIEINEIVSLNLAVWNPLT